MGNVYAAASKTRTSSSPTERSCTSEYINPGPLDNIHAKCKSVFPTCFEGARLMLSRGFSNHFQLNHTIFMSSVNPSGYRMGATYVGKKYVSDREAYPILSGDIDPSGNMNASITHQMFPNLQAKFCGQVQDATFNVSQLKMDITGSNYTYSMSLVNPDILNETGIFVLQYFQCVNNYLDLGIEIACKKGEVTDDEVCLMSGAARYTKDNYQVSGTIGASGLHFCFYQKTSEQVEVGISFEANQRLSEAVTSVGYNVKLPQDFIFRAHVDSNWSVGSVVEKKLSGLPITLAISGLINHNKEQFRLGFGVHVG